LLAQRGVLLPADDDFGVTISRHKTRLEKSFLVPVLPWERMQALADKELQFGLASQAGIDTPITAFIHGPDDLDAAADAVPFPAILKPSAAMALYRRAGFKVIVVENRERLGEAYERFSFCGSFLLQEIIPGGDGELYIAGGYHDAQSHCVALFTGRKLRQHPREFGVARLCETRWEPEVADLTVRLLAQAGYQGVSDVEFKRDARDGRLKFIEINARPGFLTALPTASGVNLSYIAYRDATGQAVPECRQRDGVRWSDILHDGPDSVRELWRGELTLRDCLAPLLGVRADAYLSLRDPWPGLNQIRHMAGGRAKRGILGIPRSR
jgi:D-aspartate ligase